MTTNRPKTLTRALVGLLSLGVVVTPTLLPASGGAATQDPKNRPTSAPYVFYPVKGAKTVKDLRDQHRQARRHRHQGQVQRGRLLLPPGHRQSGDQQEAGQLRQRHEQRWRTRDRLRLPEPGVGHQRADHPVRPGSGLRRPEAFLRLPSVLLDGAQRQAPEPDVVAEPLRRQARADAAAVQHPRLPGRILQRARRQPHHSEQPLREREQSHQPGHDHAEHAQDRRRRHPGVPGVAVRLLGLPRQPEHLGRLLLGSRREEARHRERHHLAQVDDASSSPAPRSTSPTSTATSATSRRCSFGSGRPAARRTS